MVKELLESEPIVLSTGTNVVDLGIAPMPTIAYYSQIDEISASVIVTASHNPPTDNGFKFFTGGREFIRKEEIFLEDCISEHRYLVANWNGLGEILYIDIRNQYLKYLKDFLLKRGKRSDGTKVMLDLANGAATNYTPQEM